MTAVAAWLSANGDLPRLEREVLLSTHLELGRAAVIAHPERQLSAAEVAELDACGERLRGGEPLAYVTGQREFWSLPLSVTPAVLIPRPDTEILVQAALDVMRPDARVVDLGTGSGAVALALASETGNAVLATDACAGALEVARGNAARLGLPIELRRSCWYEAVPERFDVIVSNPPYVAADDPHLESLTWEPEAALIGGADGLDDLCEIIGQAPRHLTDHGWLVVEHGWQQGAAVRALCSAAGLTEITTLEDLSGNERVTRGQRAPS